MASKKLGKPAPGLQHRRALTFREAAALGKGHRASLISTTEAGELIFWKGRDSITKRKITVSPDTITKLQEYWNSPTADNSAERARGKANAAYQWIDRIEAEIDRLDDSGKLAGNADLDALREGMHSVAAICMEAIIWANGMEG